MQGALFTELHEAVLDDVVDEPVYVAGDFVLVTELLDGLGDQVSLCDDELAYVVNHIGRQLLSHEGRSCRDCCHNQRPSLQRCFKFIRSLRQFLVPRKD